MHQKNNVVYLIESYRKDIRRKVEKSNISIRKMTSQASKENYDDLTVKDNNAILDRLSTADLDLLNKMNFLKGFGAKRELTFVLDPQERMRETKKNKVRFKNPLKQKLKQIEQEDNKSVKNPKDMSDFKDKKDNPFGNSFWNSSLMEPNKNNIAMKKKLSIRVQQLDLKKKKTDNSSDEDSESDVSSLSDEQDERITPTSKLSNTKIKMLFKELPHTLLQYPDEVDPLDFFVQYSHQIGQFIEYTTQWFSINERLALLSCNDFGHFFTGFELIVKDKMGSQFLIEFPLSASYLLLNFPPVVRLCFFNNYILNQLKTVRKIKQSFDLQNFIEVLKKLSKLDIERPSIITIKSRTRKSIFGNAKLNSIFGDKRNSSEEEQGSQLIPHFGAKVNNNLINHFHNKPKANQLTQSVQINKDTFNSGNNKKVISNIKITDFIHDIKEQASEQEIDKNALNNSSPMPVKQEENGKPSLINNDNTILESIEVSNQSSIINVSKTSRDSNSSENSETESDDSSSDSLSEEQYESTNAFEIKYAKLNYKFKQYELTIVKPAITDFNDKSVSELKGEDVYAILTNQYNGYTKDS